MILGLDISTSCTGWCVLSSEGDLLDIGNIKLGNKLSLFQKSHQVKQALSELKEKFDFEKVFIEENLQASRPGFSSAKTIVTLARFNGIVSYLTSQVFSCEPEYINVNVARKAVGLKIVSKRKGGAPTKEQVFKWASEKIVHDWPVKILKSGPRKGTTVLDDSRFDMADAYVIALAGLKLNI